MPKTNKNALNSYFAYAYNYFKKLAILGCSICAGLYVFQLVLILIANLTKQRGYTANQGMLVVGTIILLVTFAIGFIFISSKNEIKNAFCFPINRITYALGSFINILITALAIICITSVFYVIETLTYAILSKIISEVIFISTVSIIGYLEGLLPTYLTIVFILSVVYMLSMCFHQYKLPFIILFVLLVFFISISPYFRAQFNSFVTYGFRQSSIFPFALYMVGMSLAAHTLSFIPLRLMEVK